MADADEIAAFREVGGLGGVAGFLERCVGAGVGGDLVHQHVGLLLGLFFGGAAAVMGKDEQPGGDARQDGEGEEYH